MQIDCPNCDAQYNISENIALEIEHIVQCTNCLEIWKYTFPRTQEKIVNKNIKVNKLHPQVSSDIQSILQEEAAYSKNTKSLNKARSLTSKKLNISKKDLQKLNLKNWEEWRQYSQNKFKGFKEKPSDIPAAPNITYKDEWKGFGDWLSNKK